MIIQHHCHPRVSVITTLTRLASRVSHSYMHTYTHSVHKSTARAGFGFTLGEGPRRCRFGENPPFRVPPKRENGQI